MKSAISAKSPGPTRRTSALLTTFLLIVSFLPLITITSEPVQALSSSTFGYEGIGGSSTSCDDYIRGSVFAITEDGIAESITVYLRAGSGYPYKCAIYWHDNSYLVGVTEERNDLGDITPKWYTFSFSEPKPELVADTAYVLVVWCNEYLGKVYYTAGDTSQGHFKSIDYGFFPNPISWSSHNTNKYSIYCTYTAGEVNLPPTKPILVSPENNYQTSDNTPTFTWIGGTYADNHRIEVDNDNDFSSIIDNVVVDITDNSWTKSPDGYTVDNYYWRVWAVNDYGENISENVWTFEIISIPPPPPQSWDETFVLFLLIVVNLMIIIGVKIPMWNFSFSLISAVIGLILINPVGFPFLNLLLFIVCTYSIYEGIRVMR